MCNNSLNKSESDVTKRYCTMCDEEIFDGDRLFFEKDSGEFLGCEYCVEIEFR